MTRYITFQQTSSWFYLYSHVHANINGLHRSMGNRAQQWQPTFFKCPWLLNYFPIHFLHSETYSLHSSNPWTKPTSSQMNSTIYYYKKVFSITLYTNIEKKYDTYVLPDENFIYHLFTLLIPFITVLIFLAFIFVIILIPFITVFIFLAFILWLL